MNTSISVLSRSVSQEHTGFIHKTIHCWQVMLKNAITAQQFSKTDVCVVSQYISLAATAATSQSPQFISTIKGVNKESGKEKCAFKFKNKQSNTIWIFVEPLRQIHKPTMLEEVEPFNLLWPHRGKMWRSEWDTRNHGRSEGFQMKPVQRIREWKVDLLFYIRMIKVPDSYILDRSQTSVYQS